MVVMKIDPQDFPAHGNISKRVGARTEETRALSELKPGEAIKFPCRWNHYVSIRHAESCGGTGVAYGAARRAGFAVKATCRDGSVYVLRVGGKGGKGGNRRGRALRLLS